MPQEPLREYYGARASEYDNVYLKPERQSDLREIERWLPSVFADSALLEIACGTGYWTQFLAPVVSHLTAIDATQETLDIAKVRVASSVEFLLGDAYAVHLEDRRFNAGFAGFWISHVPRSRLSEFLCGFHQALTPGAKVVFLDNRFVANSSTPISRQDNNGNTYQIRSLKDGAKHEILKNFWLRDELIGAIGGRGENFRFHTWEFFWALEYEVKVA